MLPAGVAMYVVKGTALSGRPLEEKFQSTQQAYETAKKWIAAGFSDVCLREEGKGWHHGATEIRRFIAGIGQLNLKPKAPER